MPEHQIPQNDEPNQGQPHPSLSYAEVDELLPIFVLGALEPEEMLAVEDYLQAQRTLLARLASLEATAAQLAYATPAVPLPSRAKENLLARAQADVAIQQTQPKVLLAPAFPPRRVLVAPEPPRRLLPSAQPPQPPARSWFGLLARTAISVSAAAVVLLFALSVSQLWSTNRRLSQQFAAAQQQVTSLRGQNTQLQTEHQALAQKAVQLANVQAQLTRLQQTNQNLQQQLQQQTKQIYALTIPQRQLTLASTGSIPEAEGTFSVYEDTGVLVLHNLKPLPDSQAYQLWLIPQQGAPLPSDVLHLQDATAGTLTVTIPEREQGFATVGISIEPAKGSSSPTGPIVLLSTPS